MVFCTYCGQSFTRDEHLERHILTHTNVKPFKCFTCHMSFARRDLLQRHYTVHGKDQNQEIIPAVNGMIPKSAGRTPIACSNCAKTKTKCDKKFPCSRCAGRNLRCTLRPTRRTTKSTVRIGVPSDGSLPTPSPGQTTPSESEAKAQQHASSPTYQQRPTLRPATPRNVTSAYVEDRPGFDVESQPPLHLAEKSGGEPQRSASNSISSGLEAPVNGFMGSTSLGYDSFLSTSGGGSDSSSSPSFMLDWSQLQMPLGFDGLVDPQLLMHSSPEMGFESDSLPLDELLNHSSANAILATMPDFATGINFPPTTQDESPRVERAFSEMDIGNSTMAFHHAQSNIVQQHSGHLTSLLGDVPGDMGPIVAARDAWPAFKCTPIMTSATCPRTAKLNLEQLEQTLKSHGGWTTWSPRCGEADFAGADHLTVMQLHDSTRDKLLAITQTFLHKALEIHREGASQPSTERGGSPTDGVSNFVLLPPARVLEYFLRSYANCFERYYPLTSRGTLDANELMHCYNDRAASLLLLLMVAHGAMVEARMLTGGLTEASRISLFDLIEKNIVMASDPIVLQAALLFTVQAAWSGDKWQMDIAMGQRGMYFAMLKHSGALEQQKDTFSTTDQRVDMNADQPWSDWIQLESRSRLVYSWIMVDQELALFHDTSPSFSVTECATPMPDAESPWQSKTASEWTCAFEHLHGYSLAKSSARPLSLRDLFRHFLDDEMVSLGIQITPLQLRLLLHPLQSLCASLNKLLQCFSGLPTKRQRTPRTLTAESTRSRLQEVQSLLLRWFDLAERYLKTSPTCSMMQTNFIIFHLISLNAVTDFDEIEKFARCESFDRAYSQLISIHKRCIFDIEEAVYHCGQVFRLIRLMPRGIRPPWWSGAIYRAALVLWMDALVDKESSPPTNDLFPVPGPSFAIDHLPADHPLIIRYLTKREGVPCVTKSNGSQASIDDAFSVLQHCVEVIDEGAATRFSDGIRAKLERLARGQLVPLSHRDSGAHLMLGC